MPDISKNDRNLMSFLQKQGPKSVAELAGLMKVTETAVRQRLNRLSASGLISRDEEKLSRGRPVHKYAVTKQGRAASGENFSELVAAIWDEVRALEDNEIRSRVIQGIARRLALKYQEEIESMKASEGQTLSVEERFQRIAKFFESRGIPVTVDIESNDAGHTNVDRAAAAKNPGVNHDGRLQGHEEKPFPILRLHGCPYPGLSNGDELICEMEQSMFSELAGCEVERNRCDRDGQAECCSFQLEINQS